MTIDSENHPHTTVYNGDVNALLKHAVEMAQGKNPRPLKTVEGIEMPPMPKQGEVDFIYGGMFPWTLFLFLQLTPKCRPTLPRILRDESYQSQ